MVTVELLIGGRCAASQSGRVDDVNTPFAGAVAGALPVAVAANVGAALGAAVAGARAWCDTPGGEPMRMSLQAATLADERAEAPCADHLGGVGGERHGREGGSVALRRADPAGRLRGH